jgi:hypothetical protein
MDQIDHIIIERLYKLYSWWFEDEETELPTHLHTLTLEDLLKHKPISDFREEGKRPGKLAWHLGRTRYFYERLMDGEELEPIMIDNHCEGMGILPDPIITDGHHRFAAYWFANRETVPAYYSGRVDLLAYLTGEEAWAPV